MTLEHLMMQITDLELGHSLGDGASGDVAAAKLAGREVAVKVFKSETSPDGHARDEEVCPTCVRVQIVGHQQQSDPLGSQGACKLWKCFP